MNDLRNHDNQSQDRRGIAAVEMAVSLPLLVIMLLGAIDLGQFVNSGQVISNASRVGARKAAHHDTKSLSEVEAEVVNYLDTYFPNKSTSEIQSATTVSVTLADGTTVGSNGLPNLEGIKLVVTVQFMYSSVRWINGITQLDNRPISVSTTIRRL